MQYALINKDRVIEAISNKYINRPDCRVIEISDSHDADTLLGRHVLLKPLHQIKIAVICNWKTPCGISTYSQYLVNSLRPKVGKLRIFSEVSDQQADDLADDCLRCWKRGQSMKKCIDEIRAWGADFILIQHEFGIFPKATHFLRMLHDISDIPYAVMLHSVYEHKDKTICTSAIRNIFVHSDEAKKMLVSMGHTNIDVIPHGCVQFDNVQELWNTFQTPYAIIQFGFGFFYKGVDRAIEAVAHLKKTDPKFHDIFYCYLCSQASNTTNTHSTYYEFLQKKIVELGVTENVAIIQKFQPDEILNNYLRTAKLAVFPYLTDPSNTVYGASGAVRVAMANKIPVLASENHLFDDLEGVIPRPKSSLELTQEIDRVFSNHKYKESLVNKAQKFINKHSWDAVAETYLTTINRIVCTENFITS